MKNLFDINMGTKLTRKEEKNISKNINELKTRFVIGVLMGFIIFTLIFAIGELLTY